MNNKVTLQDIADALGISRNTVSRAFNNSDAVSDTTKNKIFQKATEMGYKQFTSAPLASDTSSSLPSGNANEIALFTHAFPGNSHFGASLLNSFQKKIGIFGYRLSIYIVRDVELEHLCFPVNFHRDSIAGILCLELFSEMYNRFLCSQNIPVLFIDTICNRGDLNQEADFLYMENQTSVYQMLKELIHKGQRNISFIGDRYHCQSFYERWKAYCAVMADHNIPVHPDNNILEPDSSPYDDIYWLSQRINNLPALPDVFFCANDYLAICTLKALKYMNIPVPDKVLLCGFDDAPEANIVDPPLTTVKIPSSAMGFIAAELLISRIAHPDMPYRTTYIKTDVIYRESTKLP